MEKDIRIFRDGNEWCVLCGENLHEGIAGFGKTIWKAIKNFDKENRRVVRLNKVKAEIGFAGV